jgi:hypothetical protein
MLPTVIVLAVTPGAVDGAPHGAELEAAPAALVPFPALAAAPRAPALEPEACVPPAPEEPATVAASPD